MCSTSAAPRWARCAARPWCSPTRTGPLYDYGQAAGALLAKGRLLGLQFDVLFTDDLYTRISRNAIETADRLKEGLAAKGYRFYMESPTNQVFPILENSQLEALEGKAKFGFWEKYDDTHTVMRIATSWATRMEEIEQLIDLM